MARILVIEDNPTNLELMRYVLAAFGHEVVPAEDGERGVEAAFHEHPDLIVCDLQLPGIDGLEVARRLKAHPVLRDIPLVAVTAFAMVGDRDRVLAGGFDGYIPKPIDPQAFISQIDTYLVGANRANAAAAQGTGIQSHRAAPPTNRGAGKVVLVVDDTRPNRDLLETILLSEGYAVLLARDLGEARALAAARNPDLFISDLHIGAESGVDFIKWVRTRPATAATPFMIVSSSAPAESDRLRSLEFGADRFLLRPLEPEALLDEIADCVAPRAA